MSASPPPAAVDPAIHSANLQRNCLVTELCNVVERYKKFTDEEELDVRDRYREDNDVMRQILKYLILAMSDTNKGYQINNTDHAEAIFQSAKARMLPCLIEMEALESVNEKDVERVLSSLKEDVCAICLYEFGDDSEESCRIKTCNHVFHKSCLKEHLLQTTTCPLCGQDIGTDV